MTNNSTGFVLHSNAHDTLGVYSRIAHKFFASIKRLFARSEINGNATPFIPDGYSIHSKIGTGVFSYNKKKFAKNIFPFTKEAILLSSTYKDLLPELTQLPVANAVLLDWLLDNPHQIPVEAWEGKKILFFGTLYKDRYGKLFVRYLDCRKSHIAWGICSLEEMPDYSVCALLNI